MKLQANERVSTAYAEYADGSGWSNSPIWVVISDNNGYLREECLQPEDQTEMMRRIYDVCHIVQRSLKQEVEKLLEESHD